MPEQIGSHIFKLFIGMALILAVSCEKDGDCASISDSVIKVLFLDSASGEPVQQSFDSIFILGLEDTILFEGMTGVNQFFNLPVDPFADSVAYIFAQSDTIPTVFFDTMVFAYSIQQNIISPVCGVEQVFNELSVKTTTFDSVMIVNDSLITSAPANVQVVR